MSTKENDKLIEEKIPEKKIISEKKFKVEKLRENCMQLFRITTSTFDGVFYNVHATELSIREARKIIDRWLGKEQ